MISADKKSILMIRSKQVLASISYWLTIVGYDIRDRSASARIYLLYLIAFFSIWVLAVIFFISNLMANTLSPLLASLGIVFADIVLSSCMLLLLLWSLYSIYKATKQSPLIFSEDDAHLLCQTPADRRFVSLAWFFGEWLSRLLLILAITVTISFAFLELDLNNGIKILSVRHLTIAALKPLGIIIPLHLGLFAAIWVVGVYRLQRDVKRLKIMLLLRILALILAVTLFVVTLGNIFFPSFFTVFQPLLSFLTFPFGIAFLEGVWGLGLAISIGLMGISLAVLWQISDKVNLSRAAQETHYIQAQRVAFRLGNFDRIIEMKDRKRLGSTHVPSKIPSFPGVWAMTWKDIVQSLRTLTISHLWSWVVILFLTLSLIVVGAILRDNSSLFLLTFYWVLNVGKQTSARFKKDIGNWSLIHSLPLSARRIILHDVIRPIFATIVITWIALWISSLLGLSISPIVLCSIPFIVIGISFSFIFDMLRQANISILLEGRSPDFGPVGLIIGMFCIAIPTAIYFVIEYYSLSLTTGIFAVVLASASLAILLLHLSEKRYRYIG